MAEENTRLRKLFANLIDILLIGLIGIGVFYRFNWSNWSQGTNLHPDEYGFTYILTQLKMPSSVGDYFNTRLSPLSPYIKYDIDGNPLHDGPDNRLRWGQFPIILIRLAGELSGQTGYDEIRLLGRHLSALADSITLLFTFLIGKRLFSHRVGLMASALSALAVMQIQQSHFMTVDQFATLFVMITMYAAVRSAQEPILVRQSKAQTEGLPGNYILTRQAWKWYALFGVGFGISLASRFNLLPLFGLILPACFVSVANLKLRTREDLKRIGLAAMGYLLLAAVTAGIAFRIAQPMSFRSARGDTSFFTLRLNPDWTASMAVAQNESNGIKAGPPGEQWAHRLPIIFPLMNMVVWGMGLPFGLTGWAGFLLAAYRVLRNGKEWQIHLVPLTWVGGYFLFMGTRWVKSVRYFLPIYPFLALFAAWLVMQLWKWVSGQSSSADTGQRLIRSRRFLNSLGLKLTSWFSNIPVLWRNTLRMGLFGLFCLLLFGGTFVWATAFVRAVYVQEHTRIQATRWMYRNIPAPFQIKLEGADGSEIPVQIPTPQDVLYVTKENPYIYPFIVPTGGRLKEINIAKAAVLSTDSANQYLQIVISEDIQGIHQAAVGVVEIRSDAAQVSYRCPLQGKLDEGGRYYLIVSTPEDGLIQIDRLTLANENWDEGLPLPFEGVDPFGMYYQGMTMQVRWYDDQNKRDMFLETIAKTDYIILPSQRGIWSAPRIPLTYPMTLEYYRSLFDGRLGFELVAEFHSPWQIGPLQISDVGGTIAWGTKPKLPLFNFNFFAAEEAFSVYDHPPVWIFKKRDDFTLEQAKRVLEAVDLSKVVIQGPRDATFVKLPDNAYY